LRTFALKFFFFPSRNVAVPAKVQQETRAMTRGWLPEGRRARKQSFQPQMNANGPVTVQAPNEARHFQARIAGPNAASMWNVNPER